MLTGARVNVMMSATAAKTLPMTSRGGEHCCQRGSGMCGEGEGDCNSDADCDGLLECGNHNCVTEFSKWEGLWDSGDDCCQRKCTEDRPCGISQVI